MRLSHVLPVFVAALVIEVAVFGVHNDDLLFLHRPADVLSAGSPDEFARHASRALTRDRLTVEQLETIVRVAQSFQRPDLEVLALERKSRMDGGQGATRLRLADALRRAGDPVKAERLYLELIDPADAREER